jgi:protein TonB
MFDGTAEQSASLSLRRIAGSTMIHSLLVTALLWPSHRIRVQRFVPGTPHGTRIELSYLPGGVTNPIKAGGQLSRSRQHTVPVKAPEPEISHLTPSPARSQMAETIANTQGADAGGAAASSSDALGTDNIQIALTTYSPSPKPDLSRLPHGMEGEVVLDVTIDPTGRVADLQILHALGYGVEAPVVETVRTWTFRPATKDGIPVPSVQELHFHFGPV